MTRRDYGPILGTLFFRLSFSALLIFVSLRDYLLGNGFFVYRDWSWPLSTQLAPSASFSPNAISNGAPDPFGFSRLFLTWPVWIIDQLVVDPTFAEKAFVIYLFAVFMILAYAFSLQTLRLLNKHSQSPLTSWNAEVFLSFVVTFCFANFWSLQQLSDLYYTSIIEF